MRIKKIILILELLSLSILPPFYSFSRIEGICKRKLKKTPTNKDVLWVLSNLYIYYKKFNEAKPYLEALLQIGENDKNVRLLLSRIYYNLNEYAKVKEIFQNEKLLSPRDKENYYLGNSLIELEEYEVAIKYLLRYLDYHKNEYIPYLKLGYAYYMRGSLDLALDAYKRAETLNPKDLKIKESIELCRKRSGGTEEM